MDIDEILKISEIKGCQEGWIIEVSQEGYYQVVPREDFDISDEDCDYFASSRGINIDKNGYVLDDYSKPFLAH